MRQMIPSISPREKLKPFKLSWARITAIILLFFTGLNAIIAGVLFMYDPAGKTIGMSTDYLKDSPFLSFLIPGIILFFINGVLNIVAAIFSLKKLKYYPCFILFQGIMLGGWIVVQVIMVKDINALHMTMFTIASVLLVTGFLLKKNRHPHYP